MTSPDRFDPYLPMESAETAKKMARLWAGATVTRKDDAITATVDALKSLDRVRQALAQLQPFERNALGLAAMMGGSVPYTALGLAVYATGVAVSHRYRDNDASSLLTALIDKGLFLLDQHYRMQSIHWESAVFSDERILSAAEAPTIVPLTATPAPLPLSSIFRSPPVVALDIAGILRAIDALGGLELTKGGLVRTTENRKLARAMRWPADGLVIDGLSFPNPALAFIEAFWACGLLVKRASSLALAEPLEQFTTLPYPAQVRRVLQGFLAGGQWTETIYPFNSYVDWKARHGRLALTVLLASLRGEDFVTLADLDLEFFNRIGLVSGGSSYSYADSYSYGGYGRGQRNAPDVEAKRRARARESWLSGERQWEGEALRTWAYFLGLVELGLEGTDIISLRLTNLGRFILQPGAPVALPPSPAESGAAWVVQPTFEIMVYIDQATPERMAFVERHAERMQVQQHIAQYRLTRDSIYRALESGSVLEDILACLRAGSSRDLPQNVEQEIKSWASLRERITIHRSANLIEYASGEQRQQALQKGAKGQPIGDRFLLSSVVTLPTVPGGHTFDYSSPLPPCLSITEDGIITLAKAIHDLLIEHQLDQWAERFPLPSAGGMLVWRLTRESVAAAVKAGARIADLLDVLAKGSLHPVPAMLALSLKAWAGAEYGVVLGSIYILRCPPDVLPAILSSHALRPYLLGTLAYDVIVVDAQHATELKELLEKAGLQTGGRLSVNPFPKLA